MISIDEINKLKEENERLKKDKIGLHSEIKQLEQENALLKAYKDKYYQQTLDDEIKLNELYQCLQEIKEIAEFHTTQADSEDVQEDMKQILQKIAECEVE